ncbi:MAG: aminotransferase class V-fold PLP-dependent enzyme [Candidatus Heimdallarchaeota archaeon]|nr:aminotransferase class V-fold PLP-dependent enzyme [Candidatus Heimdallarchaeota archaeon]
MFLIIGIMVVLIGFLNLIIYCLNWFYPIILVSRQSYQILFIRLYFFFLVSISSRLKEVSFLFEGQTELIAREFPQLQEMIWLNSSGTVPLPKSSLEATIKILRWHSDWKGDFQQRTQEGEKIKESAKNEAAKMLACSPDNLAYIANTSHGLNFPLHGIDWERGDNIVTSALEFPANYLPWKYRAKKSGVDLRVAPINSRGQITEEEIIALIDNDTKLVALSLVQFSNGQRVDAPTIAKVAHEHDALLCLDAIQACGGVEVYPEEMAVDFLTAGGPKFLMSPLGIGLCYISSRALAQIEPPLQGWINYDYSDGNYMNKNPAYRKGAGRFEHGSVSLYLIAGMNSSLQLINSVGIKTVAAHNQGLARMMIELFEDQGYTVITPLPPNKRGASINVRVGEAMDLAKIVEILDTQHNIKISARFGGLRLSTHLYNTEVEIQKAYEIIHSLVQA